MTVKLEASIHRYIGDTGDTKPTGVPVGSTYLDRQTSILYVTYDGTNWEAKSTIAKLAANSGVDIGDVDVASIAAGDNNIGNVDVVQLTPKAPAGVGELAGATEATQCPNVACTIGVRLKAAYDNAGRVYIGVSGVTKKDGTTDTTTGLELNAGDDSGWLPVSNLNQLYRICDNAGDDLTYIAF